MELTIRDWMVIVGIVLILAVLLDAYRRIRSERYSRVKMSSNVRGEELREDNVTAEATNDIGMLRELPNGGARVVQRSDLRERMQTPAAEAATGPATPQDDLLEGLSASEDDSVDWLEGLNADSGASETSGPDINAPGKLPRDINSEVFMLNVVCREPSGFKGEDILHILLACDLRFGDMGFFHRHEYEAGRGAIQFSVANMMQPGVFDLDNMSDFRTPGLVFFVTLPGPDDMMQAFDYMLETARCVSSNLGGDVLDESRSALTKQSLEHARAQIREMERKLLAQTAS